VALNTFDVYNTSGDQELYQFTGPPTRQNCEKVMASNAYVTGISLDKLNKGDQFCLRTDGRHLAYLLIENISRGTGDDTDIDFKAALWES
jgi:hypothetical protein